MSRYGIDKALGQGQTVGVDFVQQQDRFAHAVKWADRGRRIDLLCASAGGPPVFQECYKQPGDSDREMVFLTGLSDHCYWSLSVAILVGNLVGLEFDFACREKSPSQPVTTRYTIAPAVEAVEQHGGLTLAVEGTPRCVLAPIAWEQGPSCTLAVSRDQLAITPTLASDPLRWGFRVVGPQS